MPKHYTQLEKDTIEAAAGLSNRPGRAVIVLSYEATNGGATIEYCTHSLVANDAPESVIRAIRDLYNIIIDRIQKTSTLKHST